MTERTRTARDKTKRQSKASAEPRARNAVISDRSAAGGTKGAAAPKRIGLRGGATKNRLVADPQQTLSALGPDMMPLNRVFPIQPGLDPAKVTRELESAFDDLAALRDRNPFGNSVKLLALDINKRLDKGSLTYGGIETLVQEMTVQAYQHRADRLRDYLGERDDAKNVALLRQSIRRLALSDAGAEGKRGKAVTRPFAEFKEMIERELFGIVVTAHPTFSQSTGMMRVMAELATGREIDGGSLSAAERKRRIGYARAVEHRAPEKIDLSYEHGLSIEAIRNMQRALRRVYDIVFDVAAELYPQDWETLSPKLLTIASWVGYDLDGRSDIKWSDTLCKRLKLQALQLEQYLADIQALRNDLKREKQDVELSHLLELLESRLALAIKEVSDEMDVFSSDASGESWIEQVRRIAKRMHDGRDLRLIDSAQLLELVQRALDLTKTAAIRRKLLILRAEIGNHGLGMAHTHVRLNSVQIHNAIRKLIDMETAPDDPARKRTYLASLSRLLTEVRPMSISFASIMAERTSAKRLFMIVAQMLKYIDSTTPVRFLIAECEAPLTLLAALYFAKLFGVEHRIDISPLFETTKAFERGIRVIDESLQNPSFAEYIRKRGRLCIQTGFSDAGRHLGQTVAAVSVEWLRLKLADLMRDRGFADVEVVVFDTHGESIGRGGHPESFRARLEYAASPVSRHQFQKNKVKAKEEISFQGGDGYLHFITPPIAFTSITRILDYILEEPKDGVDTDPAYVAEEDFTKEFFITIRHFNEKVMDDPNYAALLDAFGANLLFPSGSRALKRQHDGVSSRVNLTHPTQMRAIPHNGILQQMGFLANTVGGVGQAIMRDPERFQRAYRNSPRLRRLLGMVEWALEFSDLEALKCYIDLFDPGQWLSRAYQAKEPERAAELRKVAELLEGEGLHEKLAKIYRTFQQDMLDLRDGLALVGAGGPKISPEARFNLRIIHGLRIALLMRLFMLSTHIPDFSHQYDMSREQLLSKIFHLEVDDAVRKLNTVFPKVDPVKFEGDFGDVATYIGDWHQTYEREHELIFQPIANLYTLIRRLSSGVIHTVGALG
ncbi:MAG TPA: phosphoenolpyruvate carboxylase [Dongiaceae bacterium]|nr:phosphoenolpyruvate carboxylase [Dongiaceae bacterium]